jgi:probable HAF family extracellular repeat protein
MRWIAPRRASRASTGVAVCVALLAASSSVYAQGGWTFTTIDNPAAIGTTGTFAQGINDPGQVVGYFYDSAGLHGFSKTGSSFITLNYPGGPLPTLAEGINNKGHVVGSYSDLSHNHGFLYSGGVYTAINDPSATVDTLAQGINNKDQIVGFYQSDTIGAPIFHGFLYSGGQYITLDDPSSNLNRIGSSGSAVSTTGTVAMGINNKGNIVGYYYFDNSDRAKGFIFSNGNYTTLDDPLGANGTFALGINNKDEIVGYYLDSLYRQHGFLFSNGNYTTLDDPLGINGTYATGISDASVIVGYYLSNGFNSDGGFLASIGHGFLASDPPASTVPEPSTWAMILLGFAGLGFAFRQSRRKMSFV